MFILNMYIFNIFKTKFFYNKVSLSPPLFINLGILELSSQFQTLCDDFWYS